MQKGVSVIICCYNSAARLPETLRHLALQEVPSNLQWEIILVNNASKDDTVNVAQKEWDNYQLQSPAFSILEQPIPGKNYAFELAVKEAKYSYLLTCDDDNWLEKQYVSTAYELLETNPQMGAVGGSSSAVTDGNLPEWFAQHAYDYAVGKQNETTGDISSSKRLWGAGMVLRKEPFEKAFATYTSLLSCRKGDTLSSGGDTEIALRLLLMGYTLYYDERLQFRHFIPQARLTLDYKKRLDASFDEAFKILWLYKYLVDIKLMPTFKKVSLFIKAITKRLAFTLTAKKQQLDAFNAATIFFIAGINVDGVSEDMRVIRNIK